MNLSKNKGCWVSEMMDAIYFDLENVIVTLMAITATNHPVVSETPMIICRRNADT